MHTRHNTCNNNSYSTEKRRKLEMGHLTWKRTEKRFCLSEILSRQKSKLNPIRHQQFERKNVPSCSSIQMPSKICTQVEQALKSQLHGENGLFMYEYEWPICLRSKHICLYIYILLNILLKYEKYCW